MRKGEREGGRERERGKRGKRKREGGRERERILSTKSLRK